MDPETKKKLDQNPHYKYPGKPVMPEEDESVKTFGVLHKQDTINIPKHPTKPKLKVHKAIIEKKV